VNRISALAEEDAEETSYRAYIDFTPDEAVSFGMSMEITIGEEKAEEAEDEPAEETPAEEKPEAAAEGETQGESKRERPQRPEGFEGFEGFTEGKPERPDGETGETPAAAEGEQ